MRKVRQRENVTSVADCQREILLMLRRSKTKVIAPTLTLGFLQAYQATGQVVFSERETQAVYMNAVRHLKTFMGHSLHFGAKWEDAYSRRTLPKYRVLKPLNSGYELLSPFPQLSSALIPWIFELLHL